MQHLLVEHPEPVAGVREVAQLVHEPLRIQCPTLAVSVNVGQLTLPAVEPVGAEGALSDLQVMAWHALVVDRGEI